MWLSDIQYCYTMLRAYRRSPTARGMSCHARARVYLARPAGHVSESARFATVRYGDRGWDGFDSPLGGERYWGLAGEVGGGMACILLGARAGAVVGDDDDDCDGDGDRCTDLKSEVSTEARGMDEWDFTWRDLHNGRDLRAGRVK